MKAMFEIGDRIELTHMKSATGRKLSDRKYASQVLDFDGVRTAKISMPIYENRVVPLEVNDDYQMCFFTNSGLYQCKGRIRKRYAENKMYVLEVIFITDLKKYQRRKFYRLDCMFPIQYRVVSDEESALREKLKQDRFDNPIEREQCEQSLAELPKDWKEGTISDLSGGGLRFHGEEALEKGSSVEVKLPLSLKSGIVPMTFMMKVIACIYYEGSRIAYEIRGEFQNVKDTEREVVVKYVFEEQRRRMRKE
jgi:c-di-GMP-binding flagellar brake protein YcgR